MSVIYPTSDQWHTPKTLAGRASNETQLGRYCESPPSWLPASPSLIPAYGPALLVLDAQVARAGGATSATLVFNGTKLILYGGIVTTVNNTATVVHMSLDGAPLLTFLPNLECDGILLRLSALPSRGLHTLVVALDTTRTTDFTQLVISNATVQGTAPIHKRQTEPAPPSAPEFFLAAAIGFPLFCMAALLVGMLWWKRRTLKATAKQAPEPVVQPFPMVLPLFLQTERQASKLDGESHTTRSYPVDAPTSPNPPSKFQLLKARLSRRGREQPGENSALGVASVHTVEGVESDPTKLAALDQAMKRAGFSLDALLASLNRVHRAAREPSESDAAPPTYDGSGAGSDIASR